MFSREGRRVGPRWGTLFGVNAQDDDPSLRDRLSRQGEEALGRLAEELAANPVVAGAVGRAFQARERAGQAQEAAMGALGIPSAADIERLTRRLRSVSQRLEGIEDALDRLEVRIDAMASTREGNGTGAALAIEARLDEIVAHLSSVRAALGHQTDPPSSAQERLAVTRPVEPPASTDA